MMIKSPSPPYGPSRLITDEQEGTRTEAGTLKRKEEIKPKRQGEQCQKVSCGSMVHRMNGFETLHNLVENVRSQRMKLLSRQLSRRMRKYTA
jgi:hypothetical protein